MPATTGRVRMPHNNRLSTSAALKTSDIWSKTIGHDPYAGDDEKGKDIIKVDDEKARTLLAAAREQNLTDSANRDDFARKMYLGLREKKKRRRDEHEFTPQELAALERERIQNDLALQANDSSSEEEYIEHELVKNDDSNDESDSLKDDDEKKGKSMKRRGRSKKHSRKHSKKKKRKSSKKHSSSSRKKRSKRKTCADSETDESTSDSSCSSSSSGDDESESSIDRNIKKRRSDSRSRRKGSRIRRSNRGSKSSTDVKPEIDDHPTKKYDYSESLPKQIEPDCRRSTSSGTNDEKKLPVDFIPSSRYIGPKLMYVFKRDTKGTGYYIDQSKRKVVVGCERPMK